MALFKRINSTNLSSSDRSIWLLLVVTAFSIPLSLKLYSTERDLEVIFPAELLVGLTALYVIIRWVVSQRARSALDMQALKHPIVILIALDLMISVVSYWGSDEPMVSLKWLVVRTSYVLVFFLVPLLIREFNKEKLVKLLTYHAWALILVVIWVFKAAFEQGFDRNVASVGGHARELNAARHTDREVVGRVGANILVERHRLLNRIGLRKRCLVVASVDRA